MSHRLYSKNISELTLPEMRASWTALGQDELIMAVLHQSLKTFSRYIGICGPLYVIERTYPFSDYFPEIIPTLSWHKRVTIAKGFLDLVKEFERTEMGPLYHCDVQEGNFGLTKNFSVKAIDMDLIHGSNKMMELLSGADCTRDKDCDFFDCLSKCDITAQKCTSKTLTNNLQVCNFVIAFRYTYERPFICALEGALEGATRERCKVIMSSELKFYEHL